MRIPIEHEVTVPSGVLESWWELSDLAGASGTDPGVFVMQGLVKRNGSGPDSPRETGSKPTGRKGNTGSRSTRLTPSRGRGRGNRERPGDFGG